MRMQLRKSELPMRVWRPGAPRIQKRERSRRHRRRRTAPARRMCALESLPSTAGGASRLRLPLPMAWRTRGTADFPQARRRNGREWASARRSPAARAFSSPPFPSGRARFAARRCIACGRRARRFAGGSATSARMAMWAGAAMATAARTSAAMFPIRTMQTAACMARAGSRKPTGSPMRKPCPSSRFAPASRRSMRRLPIRASFSTARGCWRFSRMATASCARRTACRAAATCTSPSPRFAGSTCAWATMSRARPARSARATATARWFTSTASTASRPRRR